MTAENIEDVEDDEDIQYVRPILMTLISLWLLFSALTVAWLMFRGYGASSTVNSILLAVGGIVSLVCGVGFWLMKKWALYVSAAYGLINQVALLALGRWNIFSLLLLVIIVYVGFRYRSEMT